MSILNGLNRPQREAVTHKLGPLLIIAGPGSGKTRTVVHSIAYAIENGEDPSKIAAFTFTREAAKELKKRVGEIVTKSVTNDAQISTFHSFCGRVVNVDFDSLRIDNEQEFIVKELTKRAEIDYIQYHSFPESDDILRFIRLCKAKNIDYSAAGSNAKEHVPDPQMLDVYVDIYKKYEQLEDDGNPYTRVQLLTHALFRDVPEVKTKWQEKFSLIFVDEYQDTDPVQYGIIKALAEKHQNLRVVGDDDQGIYGWRGADIQNILNFEKDYPNAKVISLGQNYRSTQRIVAASRALADFNPDRRDKELFTRNFEGTTVKYLHCEDHEEEASTISDFIDRAIQEGRSPSDFAVLYRTNKQARTFEKTFANLRIPYYNVNKSETRFPKQPKHAVSLMTIHKSKGLEFSNVFVVGICQELLPHFYNSNEKDWDEEIRLLYVAMTRSKNWLCLSFYEMEGDYIRGQSPFIERGYIPSILLESIETLNYIPIPPAPEDMIAPQESSDYVEPLPEQLLGDGMTVIGVDPGNIGTRNTNVGWSVTQKTSDGYSVLDFGTERPSGTQENKRIQIEQKIKALIQSSPNRPQAIAVEKLEVATEETREEWFLYVAACVAAVRNIADKESIECRLYTPQHVKYAATGNREASKKDVQKAVKRMCSNLQQIPEPHHSADAIATSLCYLRSYLNSSRFEGNKRKMERYKTGCDYIDKRQFDEAIDEFKETLYIDPIYTDAYVGKGRVHLAQNDLEAAENAARKALKLTENNHLDSQKLLDAIRKYRSGCSSLKNSEWNIAIDNFKESINQEPIFTEAYCGLSKAYLKAGNLEAARNAAEEALRLINDYQPAQKLLVDIKMRHYNNGKIYFNLEEYNQAISEFQMAVEIDQNFKGAHRFIGEVYLKLGNLEIAEKSVREALRIDSSYQLARELLEKIKHKYKEQGDGHQNRNAYSEAVKSYQQAIRIDDKYKNAYNSLGMVYRKMKEYSKAINAYQQAINIDERCYIVHTNLSYVYLEISEYTKAVSSLKLAITFKPDYQAAHYNLARTYLEMQNLPDASETVLEALRLDANDQATLKLLKIIQDAYLKRGHEYFKQDNLTAAEKEARDALRLDPNYEPVSSLLNSIKEKYYKRSLASLEQNEWKTAEKLAKEALRIDRDYELASGLLRQAYYEQGLAHINNSRYEKGINKLQKANDIDPNCERTHYYLGKAYYKLDKLKEAQLSIKEALSIQPNYLQAKALLSGINHPRNWLKLGVANVRHFTRRILKLNQD